MKNFDILFVVVFNRPKLCISSNQEIQGIIEGKLTDNQPVDWTSLLLEILTLPAVLGCACLCAKGFPLDLLMIAELVPFLKAKLFYN